MTPAVPEPSKRKAIASPCIGVCQLDKRRICIGCSRSLAEIAGWSQMTDADRQTVMDRLRARRGQGKEG